MVRTRSGDTRPVVDAFIQHIEHLVDGNVATDGIQYSSVVTFGTTALAVFSKMIDPRVNLILQELEVGFTQKFTNVVNAVGSLSYVWQIRHRIDRNGAPTIGAWVPMSATFTKGIGSLSNSEDTHSGYEPVASMPVAPFDIQLLATGLVASSMVGEVKSSSYIMLAGTVIPGT